jgi:hypothetical protein
MFSLSTRPIPRAVVSAALPAALGLLLTGCSPAPADPPAAAASPTETTSARPATAAPAGVLPAAQAYLDAVNATDLDALVAAFAPDGQVIDVSRRITGSDAVRRWAANEVIGGTLRVDGVTALGPDTQRLRVHWAPSGSGGWAADYTFTARGGRVLVADLQYAR